MKNKKNYILLLILVLLLAWKLFDSLGSGGRFSRGYREGLRVKLSGLEDADTRVKTLKHSINKLAAENNRLIGQEEYLKILREIYDWESEGLVVEAVRLLSKEDELEAGPGVNKTLAIKLRGKDRALLEKIRDLEEGYSNFQILGYRYIQGHTSDYFYYIELTAKVFEMAESDYLE